MDISKTAVLLAHEHHSNQMKNTNAFCIHVHNVIVHAKMTRSIKYQRMLHPGGF